MPKKRGMKERSWNAVGEVPRINHANRRVSSGSKPDIASALVTEMRWMPSIQKILERPNRTKPLIATATQTGRKVAGDMELPRMYARRRIIGADMMLRKNIIVSLEISLRPFCWK